MKLAFLSIKFHLFLVLICFSTSVNRFAYSQQAHFNILSQNEKGMVVEISKTWEHSLAFVIETLSQRKFSSTEKRNQALLLEISEGYGFLSERIWLETLASPQVKVQQVAFDSYTFPKGVDFTKLDQFQGEPVWVEGVGMERKKPAGTLVTRLISVDPSSGEIRRLNRLVVAIEFGKEPQTKKTATNPHLLVDSSVLSSGTWYKFPVSTAGIYRIDATFLQSIGVNSSAIDFNKIQLYGNGGKALPARNDVPRIADLAPIPVLRQQNALYFYASGTRGWAYNRVENSWNHYINPFSEESYYFIRLDGEQVNLVGSLQSPNFSTPQFISQTEGRYFIEEDREMVYPALDGGSGLDWLGRRMIGSGTTLFSESFSNLAPGTVKYRLRFAVQANPSSPIRFDVNGRVLQELTLPPSYHEVVPRVAANTRIISLEDNITGGALLTMSGRLLSTTNDPVAWLDWLEALYPMNLSTSNNYLHFSTPLDVRGEMQIALSGFSSTPIVLDITDPFNVNQLEVTTSGSSFSVQTSVVEGESPKEFVAFTLQSNNIQVPSTGVLVPNQNLHGAIGSPTLIIVTPEEFLEAANQFASYRSGQGLAVKVVTIEEIYNEFSGGQVDMRAMRDFFKFVYDNDPNQDDPLFKYVLLFGDGHFDYRSILEDDVNKNWIPTYQTDETLDEIRSYTSDDYFGLLDDNEGVWDYIGASHSSFERLDIGIGRLPIQSASEALEILEKIKTYENPATFGGWRTRYTLISDDDVAGSRNDYDLHTENADGIARFIQGDLASNLNLQKIYSISYPVVTTASGRQIPDARADILRAFGEGTLAWNYSGHGNWDGLADENLFVWEDIDPLTNIDNLPIVITATCSFGHWDYKDKQSGAEMLLLNPNGGAIAVLTTVRIVYTTSDLNSLNPGLNRAVNNFLLTRASDGKPRRLGDVLRLAKNTTAGSQGNNRKFNLLGDPTLRVGMAVQETEIVKVNGVAVSNETAQIKALDKIEIEGQVVDGNRNLDATYSGNVEVTVFDAQRNVGVENSYYLPNDQYQVQNDLIYRGTVEANQGKFALSFVVPKDISYSNQKGKIVAYAWNERLDAFGGTTNAIVGGTSDNPIQDSVGPEISLFLNDTTFVSGGITHANPKLIVKLFDENGLNTVGTGVGHEMLLVIDGDEQNAINLGSKFEGTLNSFQRGEVEFVLPEQTEGLHSLKVKAWDIVNNPSTSTLDFLVVPEESLTLQHVFNYPNPTTGATRFIFEHNQIAGTEAKAEIKIYTISGRLIKVIESDEILPSGSLQHALVQIPWDGRDDDYDELATGVYLYKLRVEVPQENGGKQIAEKIEKIAIIH